MSAVTIEVKPDPIVIDVTDNRLRVAILFGGALLAWTSPRWAGPALDFFFGKVLGL